MSITKSTSATLVSMLGAVQVTANTTARAVNTVASTLDMLDLYVQDARAAQIAASFDNRVKMLDRLQIDSAMESAKHQAQVERELASDPVLARLFVENVERFKANRELIEQRIKQLEAEVERLKGGVAT